MVTANAFSVTLSLVGAFGLGSISGAFANHYFAQRRETAAERRAATDRTFREDRDQLLELGDRADELKRELGGTRSNYIADGRKRHSTRPNGLEPRSSSRSWTSAPARSAQRDAQSTRNLSQRRSPGWSR